MTHDELLYAISVQLVHLPPYALGGPAPYLQALRAVVELHKPDSNGDCCNVCLSWPIDHEDYPCPTIQAIEKELQ
jgi:hypothetical protein